MSILVAYDHSVFSFQEQGGISRYFVELAEHLASEPDMKRHIVAPVHVCRMLRQHASLPKTGFYLPKMKNTFRLLQLINNALSGVLFSRLQPDIVHSTYYLARYRMPASCRKVVTVFDMIHEKYADRMDSFEKKLPAIKKKVVVSADHVICISEQTRRDVMELLGVREENISVIHLASSFKSSGKKEPSLLDRPYFLYVGSRKWPKNFSSFVEAFASLSPANPDVALACFGGGPFSAEEEKLFHTLHLPRENVRLFSGDDSVLQRLYSNALALVYPSLYEGFGLPILEAMACGCPVACSNTSSMPEVAGDAALYFSPGEVEEMAYTMQRLAESPATREEFIAKGRSRANRFSWEKCARETAQVYRECLREG